ncbi:MAG: pyridoxal phosphate-dependent aminotransferase [Lachnospiraceae bacterium]|nr:pyridoxal phosphate-dependent aminotransferase [Lachnospiraceae bacterium]
MFASAMVETGKKRSTIREIFEFGRARAKIVGRENIFDFSLGNPNVPAPLLVTETIKKLVEETPAELLHGYTSAPGGEDVRTSIANNLNERFGTDFRYGNLYMTVGAAASLSITLRALSEPEDEFMVFAPFFPEYRCWIENTAKAKCVVVPPRIEDFQINFKAMEESLTPHTKAVIINSPNNPGGTVYTEETIKKLAEILEAYSVKYGHPIFLISDEPYREIVYDGFITPFVTKYYKNTIVCYSYSKSLSMPGERIGYVLVPSEVTCFEDAYAAICGAGRVLGYVNAPALFQRVVAECTSLTSDISIYERNRDLLYNGLTSMGFKCVKPMGAFYLFPQSPEADEVAFCERAQKHDLLLVPGRDFGCPGHVRIAYCVKTEMIERALPVFEKLAAEYKWAKDKGKYNKIILRVRK